MIRNRTWRWLAVRIEGLLNRPPASYITVPVNPNDPDSGERYRPVWATRVQQAVYDQEA